MSTRSRRLVSVEAPFRAARRSPLALTLVALLGPLAASGAAQCELGPLTPLGGDLGDRFGSSVALSGTTAVVGAPGDSATAPYAGAAIVYDWNGSAWTETVRLEASDVLELSFFGSAVAIDGDVIVVGAPNADNPSPFAQGPGAAYVFERNLGVWTETAKLTASDGADRDNFGCAVDVDGANIAVGADNHGSSGLVFGTGAAYVYNDPGSGWIETDELLASNGVAEDGFGSAVALSGDTLLVGAVQLFAGPFATQPAKAGAVYSFVDPGTGFAETQILAAGLPTVGDRFGASLDLEADRALIGAPHDDISLLPAAGAAHVFDRTLGTWSETTVLAASDTSAGNRYGVSVALDGTRCMVAAPGAANAGVFPLYGGDGAFYVAEDGGGGWAETARRITTDLVFPETFATAVALDGDLGLTTSHGDTTFGTFTGTLHGWSVTELACPSFLGLPREMSLAAGGTQVLTMHADPVNAGQFHFVLGSITGTSPGITAGALTLPLNPDSYFFYTLSVPGQPPLSGQFGVVPPSGKKTVLFSLPPGLSGALAGLTFHHAWVVFDAFAVALEIGEAVALEILP